MQPNRLPLATAEGFARGEMDNSVNRFLVAVHTSTK
jgi:hypothetical protein